MDRKGGRGNRRSKDRRIGRTWRLGDVRFGREKEDEERKEEQEWEEGGRVGGLNE